MVGGGQGAFIGDVHRRAARLDDRYQLVAGALSSEPQRALDSGRRLMLDPSRVYIDFHEMAGREAGLVDGIDVVAVTTPNHLHHEIAAAFLRAGIHVICDKPLCRTVKEAENLLQLVDRSKRAFVLTYAFTGYAMVRHARQLISEGQLGEIRVVHVEYPQQWLATRAEDDPSQRGALWRVDPELAGPGGCVGDIGTHAFHLAEYVSGLRASSISAQLTTFVEGRRVSDDGQVNLRWADSAARGTIWFSQVAIGNDNPLKFRVFGDRGSVSWNQEAPDRLEVATIGEPNRVVLRGSDGIGSDGRRATRIPSGHPEGYLEAFAQIYTDAADLIGGWPTVPVEVANGVLPTIGDGVRGMHFIAAALASSAADCAWTPIPTTV